MEAGDHARNPGEAGEADAEEDKKKQADWRQIRALAATGLGCDHFVSEEDLIWPRRRYRLPHRNVGIGLWGISSRSLHNLQVGID